MSASLRSAAGLIRHRQIARTLASLSLAAAGLTALESCGGTNPGSAAPARREVWGFTAYWDSASAESVARNGASLDALVTTWIALDTAGGLPHVLYVDSVGAVRVPSHRLAMITSYSHPTFRPATIRRLAANPRMMSRVAGSVATTMSAARHLGAVLDFEALEPDDLPALAAVVRTIADTLHARRLGPVVVAVPASDTVAYPARLLIEAGADFILPMLYDQHWAGGTPGPVAEARWVDEMLGVRVREAGAARIIAGLPLYGYRWAAPGQGVTVSFSEAQRATESNLALSRDSTTGSLRGNLAGGGEVWVTDAALLRELVKTAEGNGVHRLALWYIGQEDPAIWRDVLARPAGAARKH